MSKKKAKLNTIEDAKELVRDYIDGDDLDGLTEDAFDMLLGVEEAKPVTLETQMGVLLTTNNQLMLAFTSENNLLGDVLLQQAGHVKQLTDMLADAVGLQQMRITQLEHMVGIQKPKQEPDLRVANDA